ncbi:uncharacterized protein LOC112567855 [Pomacea canaliculata]|uniref:uncharacterized protein LOC112567855 n=1 Tax=Pomacea canaliculata TaxID=400727 RepID=UPI000D729487|nr:uncharacterized protein LOC112567855 [Pomacea canaliculata]
MKIMPFLLFSILLCTACAVTSDESSCETTFNEDCIKKVTVTIKGKCFEQRRPFHILYDSSGQQRRTVATLNYQEKYTCDSVKDFICNDMMNNTFVISTETSVSCMNGNVTLSPDGDLDIACQQSKEKLRPLGANIELQAQNGTIYATQDQTNSDAAIGGIIAGLVGLSAVVIIVLLLIFFLRQKKKKMHTQNSPSNEGCGGPKETEQQSFLEKPVQKPGRKKQTLFRPNR